MLFRAAAIGNVDIDSQNALNLITVPNRSADLVKVAFFIAELVFGVAFDDFAGKRPPVFLLLVCRNRRIDLQFVHTAAKSIAPVAHARGILQHIAAIFVQGPKIERQVFDSGP